MLLEHCQERDDRPGLTPNVGRCFSLPHTVKFSLPKVICRKSQVYDLRVGGARVCTKMARPYRTSASSKLLPEASTPSILSFH